MTSPTPGRSSRSLAASWTCPAVRVLSPSAVSRPICGDFFPSAQVWTPMEVMVPVTVSPGFSNVM
jgi:hypothetical protein